MATPAVPTRELILAMEELELLGWLPNRRWAVRARASTTELALHREGADAVGLRRTMRTWTVLLACGVGLAALITVERFWRRR